MIRGLTASSAQCEGLDALYQNLDMAPDSVSYLLIPGLIDIPTETATHISALYHSDSPVYSLPIGVPGIAPSQGPQILPSLVQAALALSNRLVPGNPAHVSFHYQLSAPLYLTRKHRPWFHRQSQKRRAAIHDVYTGTHLVLEEILESSPLAYPLELPFQWEAELAIFSAVDHAGMVTRIAEFIQQLEVSGPANPAPVDIAVALKEGVDLNLPYRLAIVFKNVRNLKQLAYQALEQLQQDV